MKFVFVVGVAALGEGPEGVVGTRFVKFTSFSWVLISHDLG